LRDLYDHTVQIIDTIETFRDIIAWSLDIYLSSTSNRLNEVMKVLTVISTIFIPLTFLVWVYWMNFRYMPELWQKWTYPILWIIMLSVWIWMFTYFKRKKWI
jgi:magnesium transporter